MELFEYFCCDGGPHIVLPSELRSVWQGASNEEDPLDPTTDYGRACKIESGIAVLKVGDGMALVFGGSPPMSAWNPRHDGSRREFYVLDAWNIDLDPLIKLAADFVEHDGLTDTGLRWSIKKSGATLMAGADRGLQPVYDTLSLPIPAGNYMILRGTYNAEAGNVQVYRLVESGAKFQKE
jgi:hypothetical protein